MTNKVGRLGVTLLDSDFQDYAYNDELLINMRTGRLYYKNVVGEMIDLFDNFMSNIPEERIQDVEEALDRLFLTISNNGPAKTVHFKYSIKAEYDGQSTFDIPLAAFKPETDLMIVNIATTVPIEGSSYIINEDNQIVFNGGFKAGTEIFIIIFKNVPHVGQDDTLLHGDLLENDSVSLSKLTPEVREAINNSSSGAKVLMQEEEPPNMEPGTVWVQILSEEGV